MNTAARPLYGCWICGAELRHKGNGRPRKYCSDACRQKAFRTRHVLAALAEVEKMRLILADHHSLDWEDSHRVA